MVRFHAGKDLLVLDGISRNTAQAQRIMKRAGAHSTGTLN
jgi:hypothetical protein